LLDQTFSSDSEKNAVQISLVSQESQSKMDNDSREPGEHSDQELYEDAIINKVTALLGYTEMLLARKPQDSRSRELLTKAWDTARDLADMIYRRRELRSMGEK
jgi:hypothetical protein